MDTLCGASVVQRVAGKAYTSKESLFCTGTMEYYDKDIRTIYFKMRCVPGFVVTSELLVGYSESEAVGGVISDVGC